MPGLRGISKTAPYFINNSAPTLEAEADHYIALFSQVEANYVPGPAIAAFVTTDGVHFDRKPTPEERAPRLAYLRKHAVDQAGNGRSIAGRCGRRDAPGP